MSDIDIAQLARRSGVRASALRYYEDKGLIVSSGRRGLKRLFDPAVSCAAHQRSLGRRRVYGVGIPASPQGQMPCRWRYTRRSHKKASRLRKNGLASHSSSP